MNMPKLFLLTILIAISSNNCFDDNPKSATDIEGLWISNEETSSHFASGTQMVVLEIRRDNKEKLAARGIFLWNGDYQSEWKLVDIEYDTLTQRITIYDADGDTLKAIIDKKKDMITGAIYLQDNSKNPLSFLRADKNLVTKLFHPRIPDMNGNITCSYKAPEQLEDGLQTASISSAGVAPPAMNRLIKEIIDQKYGRIESLLILKDNKLIFEEYFYGYTRTSLHKIYSCTKSITSLLLGIVLDRHTKIKLNQSIFSFFPEYDSLKTIAKERITLKHVLTMTSGLQWYEYPKEMYKIDDRIKYVLERPMEAEPGEKFLYNSGCAMVIGGVITSLEGKQAKSFADHFLFKPLGITNYVWDTYKNGNLEYWNGLHLLPRDMAKIGLLVLSDGKWQNKQIVSKEWIRESTRPHVAESDYFNYGYQWWHRSRKNKPWWQKLNAGLTNENDMIIALAYGGQYIMVIRDLNMVVVSTASNFDNKEKELCTVPMVIEEIVPIFKSAGV